MAAKAKKEYGNESISTLKGADRVRKRPGVIFGSDGLEGCEHSVFEILSNAIDEARQGYGKKIITTRYADGSVEVQDFGRGCPVDYNPKEQRYNWELVFCELYAGGKYDGTGDGNYEYALGLNGLGSCATQYSSEYMDVEVLRDGKRYNLHFEKGENIGGLKAEPYTGRQTGTRIRWKPGQPRRGIPAAGPAGEGLCRGDLLLPERHPGLLRGAGGGEPPHPRAVLDRGAHRPRPRG